MFAISRKHTFDMQNKQFQVHTPTSYQGPALDIIPLPYITPGLGTE